MFRPLICCIIMFYVDIKSQIVPVVNVPVSQDNKCSYPLDVIFLIDGSSSVEDIDFRKVKNFTKNLLSKFVVGELNTRVGIIEFASIVGNKIEIKDSGEYGYLLLKIDSITKTGGDTQTHLALQDMIRMFNDTKRTNVPQVGVCITDGKSRYPNSTKFYADKAKSYGITMFAIGKDGASFRDELEFIASGSNFVNIVMDFDSLPTDLATRLCAVAAPNVQPSTLVPNLSTPGRIISAGDDGYIDNNRYYSSDLIDCTKFYISLDVKGKRVTFQEQCPFGLFWNQYLYACSHPGALRMLSLRCINDPCQGFNMANVPMSGYCGGYWICKSSLSVNSGCCDFGKRYDFTLQKCDFDPSCTTPCIQAPKLTNGCNKIAIPGNVTHYIEYIQSYNGNITRPCATGSGFDQTTCECSVNLAKSVVSGNIQTAGCRTIFYLPIERNFDSNGLTDKSGNQHLFYHKDVSVVTIGQQDMAYFNGLTSFCNIWRFSSDDNRKMLISFEFAAIQIDDPNATSLQAILTNCYFADPCLSTLSFIIDRSSHAVGFQFVLFNSNATNNLTLSYNPNITNKVSVTIEDTYILLSVNDKQTAVNVTSYIKTSPSGLIIGAGGSFDHFKGYIDEKDRLTKNYRCFSSYCYNKCSKLKIAFDDNLGICRPTFKGTTTCTCRNCNRYRRP